MLDTDQRSDLLCLIGEIEDLLAYWERIYTISHIAAARTFIRRTIMFTPTQRSDLLDDDPCDRDRVS